MPELIFYTKQQLINFNHTAIRQIASQHNIKSPTSKNKDTLIEQILLCQDGNGSEFISSSLKKMGRPKKDDISSQLLYEKSRYQGVPLFNCGLRQSDMKSFITIAEDLRKEYEDLSRYNFNELIAIYPNQRLRLEKQFNPESILSIIDTIAPLGMGQRGLIVSPPDSGNIKLLKLITTALKTNYPELILIMLMVDERPEEVTEMKESLKGVEIVYSTFDQSPSHQVEISELCLKSCCAAVEAGHNVVLLVNSITRLAHIYSQAGAVKGIGNENTHSLLEIKKFFGSGRNIKNGGSLTILASSIIETGIKIDDQIFDELKERANVQICLHKPEDDKSPCTIIDYSKSQTFRDELLLNEQELEESRLFREKHINK